VTAVWPSANVSHGSGDVEAGTSQEMNEAVIWDTIITSPSSDHMSNLAPVARKKLIKSGQGKSIDPSRFVFRLFSFDFIGYKLPSLTACADICRDP